MTVAFDHCTSQHTGSSKGRSFVRIHSMAAATENAGLLVFLAIRDPSVSATQVSYTHDLLEIVSLHRLATITNSGDGPRLEVWGSFGSFDTGSHDRWAADFSADTRAVGIGVSLTDVSPESIVTASDSGDDLQAPASTPLLAIAGKDDGMVLSFFGAKRTTTGAPVDPTAGLTMTEQCSDATTNSTGGNNVFAALATRPTTGGGDVDLGWDVTDDRNHDWAHLAVALGAIQRRGFYVQILE